MAERMTVQYSVEIILFALPLFIRLFFPVPLDEPVSTKDNMDVWSGSYRRSL